MAERTANAEWKGTVMEGTGRIALGSGLFEAPFSFESRMGEGAGTNPEELLGAALAGCYAMALNATLERAGTPAQSVWAKTNVFFGKDDSGFTVRRIDLETKASVKDMDDDAFQRVAEEVKTTCPISKALASVPIKLSATLEKE